MKEMFELIYDKSLWGEGSGDGSKAINTIGYRRFLQQFIREKNIESVVDFGCGDWQSCKYIDWGSVAYLGVDVVESVVQYNIDNYSSVKVNFRVIDWENINIPKADLLIVKDVLQHWPEKSIFEFIPILYNFKYFLVVNDHELRGDTINRDVILGGCRPLDLRKKPFYLPLKAIYEFTDFKYEYGYERQALWRKVVLLGENFRFNPS